MELQQMIENDGSSVWCHCREMGPQFNLSDSVSVNNNNSWQISRHNFNLVISTYSTNWTHQSPLHNIAANNILLQPHRWIFDCWHILRFCCFFSSNIAQIYFPFLSHYVFYVFPISILLFAPLSLSLSLSPPNGLPKWEERGNRTVTGRWDFWRERRIIWTNS